MPSAHYFDPAHYERELQKIWYRHWLYLCRSDELPEPLSSLLQRAQLYSVRQGIEQIPASELRPRLRGPDWLGAFGVFILVVLSTFPVVIPFVFIDDVRSALRISNALAVISLFLCGFFFARYAGLHPWLTGLIMVAIGIAMVSITIALGG